MKDVRVIEVKKSVFESNDERAALLRKDLKDKGVFLLNLMSSPGAGKTTTLTRTIEQLKDDLRIGVMEADIDSDVDAITIAETGAKAIQLHTGGMCHLAAQSSVAYSWKNPTLTIDVNIKGCVNLLDAVRQLDKKPRVLLIGSGEEYGHIKEGECPIVEDNTVRPGNIYAATKACQNMLGKIYSDAYGLDIMMVRAFNHIGPNQTPMFVVADFCKQVADIEKGRQEPVIYVGNLSAKRDFTDVRDVVKAYALLVEHGRRGETYNVGTGHAIAISQILDEIVAMSDTAIEVKVDENKLRPVDVPIIEPDIDKIKSEVGWQPVISLEQTLKETLEHWRSVD